MGRMGPGTRRWPYALDADGRLLPAAAGGSYRQHGSARAQPRPDPARPRPGAAQQARRARRGCGHRRRGALDGPDAAAACSAAAGASECQGRQAGAGPARVTGSRRSVRVCGRRERSEPSGAALSGTHTGAHAGPGPCARTRRAGPLRRLPLTRRRTGAEPSRDPQDAHPHFPARARTSWAPSTQDTRRWARTLPEHRNVRIWAEAPTAHICRTHDLTESWMKLLWHCTPPPTPPIHTHP